MKEFVVVQQDWEFLDSDLSKKESLIQEEQRKIIGSFVFNVFYSSVFHENTSILFQTMHNVFSNHTSG